MTKKTTKKPAPKQSTTKKPAKTATGWTDEKLKLLAKLYPTATWQEIHAAFPGLTRDALVNKAIRNSLKRPVFKPEPRAQKPTNVRDQLIEFLTRSRTDGEIVAKFGKDALDELKLLAGSPPQGFNFCEGRNHFQEKTSYLERSISGREIKVEPRVWTMLHSENDPDYLAIIFPPELDFTKDQSKNALRIFPIDTVKYGDHRCDEDRFKKFLRYLEKPYAFAFLNGAIIGGSGYDKISAVVIRDEFRRLLAPYAHKILWAQSGQHEQRMTRVDGVEPLQAICRDLGIYHTDRPVSADIYWKLPTKPIESYAIHGCSNARKDGAKANSARDIVMLQNFPHFTFVGHLQEGMSMTYTVRRLDPIKHKIKEQPANVIICPGFMKFEGSDAEKKGYPPPATGTVVAIIGADNTHKASS